MDKHICRAKRIDNGEWVLGYYVECTYYLDDTVFHMILPTDVTLYPRCEFTELYNVNPDTVCRYIGAYDKNGTPIFEGDIIDASTQWWDAAGPAGHDSPIILVEWNDDICGFDPFANYDCDCGVYIEAEGCVVIGNKFDNTNLMEG